MEELLVKRTAINSVFKKNRVILALVYGSVAKRKESRLSDLDMAVFLDDAVLSTNYPVIRLRLLDELGRIIKSRPIDLAILNDASPLLRQMVVTRGKLIFSRGKNVLPALRMKSLKEFDDAFYLKKTYYFYQKQRVMGNKLGEIYAG